MAIVCEIDATGIHKPDFSEILEYLKAEYRGIYGEDVYLENDSQDGQLLGIFAAAINDANAMAVAVYNAFSPSTALGVGLSRVVKINGISRNLPSYSSADLEIVGQSGSTITGGLARDVNGYLWALPPVVNIPPGGAIVRRQNIWRRSRRKLAECGPRLGFDVRRRARGAASADIRWSVA